MNASMSMITSAAALPGAIVAKCPLSKVPRQACSIILLLITGLPPRLLCLAALQLAIGASFRKTARPPEYLPQLCAAGSLFDRHQRIEGDIQ
jgi:hypothetical protein